MSVFGGDSWSREAQHRKRRVDDLLLSSLSSSSTESSYKRLSNGKFACLVCPHNPVLDSLLSLSMHAKGSRHIAAEFRLRDKELSKKEEVNKRIALSSDSKNISDSSSLLPKLSDSAVQIKRKPLIEKTRQILLETQSHRDCTLSGQPLQLFQQMGSAVPVDNNIRTTEKIISTDFNVILEWNAELRKRHEEELRFTAAGWKRDGHGKWYKDENAEFDSDEEDPNSFFC